MKASAAGLAGPDFMLQGHSSPPRSESSAALVTLLPTFRVVLSLVAQLVLRGHEPDSDSDESPRSHSGGYSLPLALQVGARRIHGGLHRGAGRDEVQVELLERR